MTMDDADRADERTQNIIDGGIAIAREKAAKIRALEPCGQCYYCGHTLNVGFVFCADDECMTDYYHEIQRKKDLGK